MFLGRKWTTVVEEGGELAEFWSNVEAAHRHFASETRRTRLQRLNQALGNPIWWPRMVASSVREGLRAVANVGPEVLRRHGVELHKQFVEVAMERFNFGTRWEEYYYHELFLSARRRERLRVFPSSILDKVQLYLDRDAPDCRAVNHKLSCIGRLLDEGIPTIPVIATFQNGQCLLNTGELPECDLFSKPVDDSCGRGTALWKRAEDGMHLNPHSGERLSVKSLLALLAKQSLGAPATMLQSAVRNHSELLALTSGGLSTIRIITCRTQDGNIDFMPPSVRMPTGASVVDNFERGGLCAPIALETGRICGSGIRKSRAAGLEKVSHHPDTGAKLEGFLIPYWKDALVLARRAHLAFPSVHFVGWDVAILEHGPVVLEGNLPWGADLAVVPHGITLADTQYLAYYNHHIRQRRRLKGSSPALAA